MENVGGGVASTATVAHWRIMSQPSTLDDFFLANDLTETLKNISSNNNDYSSCEKPVSRVTLGLVLDSDKKPPPSNATLFRTLLEVINVKSARTFKSSQKLKQSPRPRFPKENQHQNQNQSHSQNEPRLSSVHRRKYSC